MSDRCPTGSAAATAGGGGGAGQRVGCRDGWRRGRRWGAAPHRTTYTRPHPTLPPWAASGHCSPRALSRQRAATPACHAATGPQTHASAAHAAPLGAPTPTDLQVGLLCKGAALRKLHHQPQRLLQLRHHLDEVRLVYCTRQGDTCRLLVGGGAGAQAPCLTKCVSSRSLR